MDQDNSIAQNSIEGALNVVSRNNLGTIGAKKTVQIQDEKLPITVKKGMCLKICVKWDKY